MRALLLAAGFGTRLRPLTDTIPKCLVPIKGKPLLAIWFERLSDAGIGPFIVNTHYLAEQIERFLRESHWDSSVSLVHEAKLLGTAGTLLANLDFFQGEDGMLVHADNYCLADFDAFVAAHRSRSAHCLMTMMTFTTDKPSACGVVELDSRGVVISFHEKVQNPPGNIANGAVYILSDEMLKTIASTMADVTDFSIEVLQKFIGRIYTYHTDAVFIDVGTPQNYLKANEGYLSGMD